MAELIPNEFTSYKLTEQEELEGSILTITQKHVLHNLLSIYAMEKNTIEYDPEKTMEFVQQEAYKRGQMEAMRHVLAMSEAAVEALYPNDNQTQLDP